MQCRGSTPGLPTYCVSSPPPEPSPKVLVLEIEHRASCMLGKCSITELHSQLGISSLYALKSICTYKVISLDWVHCSILSMHLVI
ncbi:mCG147483 [Mus musculus]|nr:mCG147483 [Mus musculus]